LVVTFVVAASFLVSACSSRAPDVSALTAGQQTAADRQAVAALHGWMRHATTARETTATVDFDAGGTRLRETSSLTGKADIRHGLFEQSGTQTLGTAPTAVTVDVRLLHVGHEFYFSIPAPLAAKYPGKTWSANSDTNTLIHGHSIWWTAQQALSAVRQVGPARVDGQATTKFTGVVDLRRVPGMTASLLRSHDLATIGAPLVAIDLFIGRGGHLVELDYHTGLPLTASRPDGAASMGSMTVLDEFGTSMPAVTAPPADEVMTGPLGSELA
jgi:hypothetical protein